MLATPFLKLVHPDDVESTAAQGASITQGAKSVYFENRFRCKDGTYKWLSWNSALDVESQLTHFVVRDITRACALALGSDKADGRALNVGTGKPTSVLDVAAALAKGLGVEIEPRILGEFRAGDIRHCYADTRRAEELLGFRAEIAFEDGMRDLLAWLETQEATDSVDAAYRALAERKLTR